MGANHSREEPVPESHVPDRQRRFKIADATRYLQLLREAWRTTDETNPKHSRIVDEITRVVHYLVKLGVPVESLNLHEDHVKDARDDVPSLARVRKVRFSEAPLVAFYESDRPMDEFEKTPLQKHASLEEIYRHQDEMDKAYDSAETYPLWFDGGSPDEEEKEEHRYRSPEERLRRASIRKWGRYYQLLLEFLRNEDDEEKRAWLEDESLNVLAILRDLYNIDPQDKYADYFEDAKEYVSPKEKKVRFQIPTVAFYESENIKRETPLQKHASLEELQRHELEMDRAYQAAEQNPIWFEGGCY